MVRQSISFLMYICMISLVQHLINGFFTDVNHELSVLQDKHTKLDDANQDLESKLTSSEKQNVELQNKLQQQLTRSPSSRASTPDRTSGYYEPTLSRMPTHRSRIPRTSGIPGSSNIGNASTYTGNNNPVKMVQDMVGRVRVCSRTIESRRVGFFFFLITQYLHLELRNTTTVMSKSRYASAEPSTILQLNYTNCGHGSQRYSLTW